MKLSVVPLKWIEMIKMKTRPTVVRFWWQRRLHAHVAGNSGNRNNPFEKQVSEVSETMKCSCKLFECPAEWEWLIKPVPTSWREQCAATRNATRKSHGEALVATARWHLSDTVHALCLQLCQVLLDKIWNTGSRGTSLECILSMPKSLRQNRPVVTDVYWTNECMKQNKEQWKFLRYY